MSQWGYRAGQCPQAEQACRQVINLPTDRPLSSRQLAVLFEPVVTTAVSRQQPVVEVG